MPNWALPFSTAILFEFIIQNTLYKSNKSTLMELRRLSMCVLMQLIFCSVLFAQRPYFNKNTDILIAQFDSKPDPDDIHAQAALGCMLAHSDLAGVNYYAVAGAVGTQNGEFIDSDALFNMAFGNNWTDAHANWSASVTNIKNEVLPILQSGGKVWVQEAGQSNITADWIAQVLQTIPSATVKSNVIVVQHSNWNENNTASADLQYVKDKATYFAIDDGNAPDGAGWGDRGLWSTPEYRSQSSQWMASAKSSQNPVASQLWTEADRVIDEKWPNGYPHDWSYIHFDGVDYSDCVENWWIFDIGSVADNTTKFWSRYVTNVPTNPGNNTVSCASLPSQVTSSTSITVNISYEASQNRDVVVEFWNTGWLGQGTTSVTAGSGTATVTINLSSAPVAGSGYLFKSSIRPTGGDWTTNLNSCQKNNVTVSDGSSPQGAWMESDGYLVIDAESLDFNNAHWSKHTSGGIDPWGNGYIQYDGPDRLGAPVSDAHLTYDIKIATPGTYQFIWRTGYGFNSTSFDGANDSWLKINGTDFYGMKNGVKTGSKDHFMKVWVQKDAFVNECFGEHAGVNGLTIFADFDTPGYYSIEISGRSQGHVLDRFFLFQSGKEGLAMANNGPESPREGGQNPVAVTGVTVTPASASLAVGQTVNLDEAVQPSNATNQSVTWSSSNTSVATVDANGVVTGNAVGTAIITATTADGGFTDTANITVSGGSTVDLSAIHDAYLQGTGGTLFNNADLRVESGNRTSYLMFDLGGVSGNITEATLELSVGNDNGSGTINIHLGNSNNWTEGTLSNSNKPTAGALLGSLNATYAIGQSYTWTLDASQLSSGTLLSLIVSASGGNDVSFASDEHANASLHPVLSISTSGDPQVVPVTGVSVTPTSGSIEVGQTIDLNETVSPSNATDPSVVWSSSNSSIASVSSSGLVTGVAVGTATITVTTNDGGFTASSAITVSASPSGQAPYGGTNRTLPGLIEAEDYDTGGEGVAYHDTDVGNNGNQYRTDDVDIEARDGGLNVGWGADGEWLEYTVDATAGTYSIEARMAAVTNGKTMTVKLDGAILGTIDVPNTGDWAVFQTVSINNVSITGGNDKVLRFELNGGGMNLNWVNFVQEPSTVPVTGVSVSPSTSNLEIGQTQDLTETVSPSNATNPSVTWSSSNPSIATVNSNGLVTAIAQGSATITVTTNDGGFTASSAITVNPPAGCDLPWSDTDKTITQTTLNYSSGPLDISCVSSVKISMTLAGTGPMENADYLNVYYKIDGGSQLVLSENSNSFASKQVEASVSGSTVELIINGYSSWSDETFTVTDISVVEEATSANLLSNPGFETGDLTAYGSWGAVSVVANNQQSGSYAVTVNGAGAPSQVVSVSPNTTYTFSVWGKVAATGQSVNVGVKNHGAPETSTQLSSTNYTRVSHTFTTGASATSAQVYFYCPNASYQAWGDDFELVEGNLSVRKGTDQLGSVTVHSGSNLSVYPNPLYDGDLKVNLSETIDSGISIYNLHGQVIFHQTGLRGQVVVPGAAFKAAGLYVVHITEDKNFKQFKLTISR